MFRTRRVAAFGAALAAAIGLFVSGCGQITAGAAALVGDQRIAVEEVSQSVQATEQAATKNGLRVTDKSALVRAVLTHQIKAVIVDEAARRKGISVSRSDVDRQIAQYGGRKQLERQALQSAVPPQKLRQFIHDQLIQAQLAQRLSSDSDVRAQNRALMRFLRQVAQDLGVQVSPRYGNFNIKQLSVVPEKSKLSTPDNAGTGTPRPAGRGGG